MRATTPLEVIAQHRLPPGQSLRSGYCAAVSHSATPPWLEQVPLRCCDFEYVPSLHLAVAPVGSVLPAVVVGADFVAVGVDFAAVAAGAAVDAAAGAAAAGAVVEVVLGAFGAFCTPP